MAEIYKYEILEKILDKTKPWYQKSKNILYIPNISNKYRYYIECAINIEKYGRQYFLLMHENKFNVNCRKCNIDGYGRIKIIPRGEFKEFLEDNIKSVENVVLELQEKAGIYDAYCVSI